MRDVVTGLGVAFLSLGFLLSAGSIHSSETGLVGPAFVPMLTAGLGLALGLLLSLSAFLSRRKAPGNTAVPPRDTVVPWKLSETVRVLFLTSIGFLFVFLFPRIGYEAGVFVFLVLLLIAFGERKPGFLITVGLLGAIGFHLLFRTVMGVFMPTGRWFDVMSVLGGLDWGF